MTSPIFLIILNHISHGFSYGFSHGFLRVFLRFLGSKFLTIEEKSPGPSAVSAFSLGRVPDFMDGAVTPMFFFSELDGGFKHECYFPFYIWDVILPIGYTLW